QFADDLTEFLQFGREIGLLVKQKRRVAKHAHILNTASDAPQVDLGEPTLPLPLVHQPGKDIILFPIGTCLLASHADAKYLVRPFRQIREHLLASPAQQNRFELTMDLVQATVAKQFSLFVFHAVFLKEPES